MGAEREIHGVPMEKALGVSIARMLLGMEERGSSLGCAQIQPAHDAAPQMVVVIAIGAACPELTAAVRAIRERNPDDDGEG